MKSFNISIYKPNTSGPINDEHQLPNDSVKVAAIVFDEKYFRFTVENYHFEKKVYTPCEFTFQLNVAGITDKSKKTTVNPCYSLCPKIAEFLKGYYVRLDVRDGNGKESNAFYNYYIYDVRPCFTLVGGTPNIQVFVKAYSLDHKLTLLKHNRSFTSKRFVTDLVSKDLAKDGAFGSFGVPFKKKNLQFIGCTKVDPNTKQEQDFEIIQPYMVQYNETYYNFLARTANRCGEFLYFEDGKLNIGLDQALFKKFELVNYDDTTKSGIITSISLKSLDQSLVYSVEPYYPKFMDEGKPETSFAPKKKVKEENQKGEVIEKEINVFVEDAMVGSDEYLGTMEKGKWVDWLNHLFVPSWPKKVISWVPSLLNNQTIGDTIADVAVQEGLSMASSRAQADKINSKMDESYWDKLGEPDKYNNDKTKAYMFTSDASRFGDDAARAIEGRESEFQKLLSQKFYHALLSYEREAAQEAISVETGTEFDADVKLGKIVQLNGRRYVVVGVSGDYKKPGDTENKTAVENYSFTIIPLIEITSGMTVIPPLYEHGHICYSPMQRAVITNPSDPQYLGRVQIRYPWQFADADASPFIRMAKDFAGGGFGISFTPDKDTEVLIDYEGGNVERPFVVGALHNRVNKPQRPTRSIKSLNGHKIVFNDPKDGTAMWWNMAGGALKLLTQTIPVGVFGGINDHKDKKLAGGIEMSDEYGFYKISMSTENRAVSINSPFGTVSINAFTGITLSAPNGDIKINGKNVTISASNEVKVLSGTQIPKIIGETDDNGECKSWNVVVANVDNICKTGLSKILNLIFPDISLLRAVFEALVKPCAGTLQIKAYRHLMLEAGKGVAQFPKESYRKLKEADNNNTPAIYNSPFNSAYKGRLLGYTGSLSDCMADLVRLKERMRDLKNAHNAAREARQRLNNILVGKLMAADDQLAAALKVWFDGAIDGKTFDAMYNGGNGNHRLPFHFRMYMSSCMKSYEDFVSAARSFNEIKNAEDKKYKITTGEGEHEFLEYTTYHTQPGGPKNDNVSNFIGKLELQQNFDLTSHVRKKIEKFVKDINGEGPKNENKYLKFKTSNEQVRAEFAIPALINDIELNTGRKYLDYLMTALETNSISKLAEDWVYLGGKKKNDFNPVQRAFRQTWNESTPGEILLSDNAGLTVHLKDITNSSQKATGATAANINVIKNALKNLQLDDLISEMTPAQGNNQV